MDSFNSPGEIIEFTTQYYIYTSSFIFLSGLIGNTINLLIFTQIKSFRDDRSAFYLRMETISNLIRQTYIIIFSILLLLNDNDVTRYTNVTCRVHYFLIECLTLITFSMICCQSVDHFLSRTNRYCTLKSSYYLSFVLILTWISHSSLSIVFVRREPTFGCTVSNRIWIEYLKYFFYPILLGFLPISISLIFSLLSYKNVRHIIRLQVPIERRRFARQLTSMILLRIGFFIIFSVPYNANRVFMLTINNLTDLDPMCVAKYRFINTITTSIMNLIYIVNHFKSHVESYYFLLFFSRIFIYFMFVQHDIVVK